MITKLEAYQYGLNRGYECTRYAAFREGIKRPPLSLREAEQVLREEALEAEMNSRQYADFCYSDLCSMPCSYQWYETVWESYEQGVVNGVDNYIRNI